MIFLNPNLLRFFYGATGRVKMKTFTVSAIAFYFFYVLNGLMAPGHAARVQQSACQEASFAQTGSSSASAAACKRDRLASSQAIAAR